jgi:prepilin-type N-terminal cleavage/methylation domain-containing protein
MQVLRDPNGFTLIEILIATVIITITSLGIATLSVGVIRGNSFSKRQTTAAILAQDRLEQVKRIGYTNAGTVAGTENYGDIANYTGYKRVTSVANNTPMSNTRTVDVIVYWEADSHSVNLSTILAE